MILTRLLSSLALASFLLAACTSSASSGAATAHDLGDPRQLSLERLYHPTLRESLIDPVATQLAWLSDGVLQETVAETGTGLSFVRVDPSSGAKTALLDGERARAALTGAGLESAKIAPALAGGLIWNDARSAFAVRALDDWWYVDLVSGSGLRLTNQPGAEDEPSFSPDGQRLAFLRGSELWVSSTSDGSELRLTLDGSETLFNGRLDWVYQEEVYGRGNWRGFWWSPDSASLAYLQLDESQVPLYPLLDHRPLHQELRQANYPKVGDPNPTARLGVVSAGGGATRWTRDPHAGSETLIVNVGWTPAGELLAQWQNRAQTWLELLRFDAALEPRVLLREESPAWVERAAMPLYLPDGSFLWESDRSGFHHVYHCDAHGRLLGPVTSGEFDVRVVHGFDAASGRLFFSAPLRSPLGLDAASLRLDGSDLRLITPEGGTHALRFSPDFRWYLDLWSDIHTPTQQWLCRIDPESGGGATVRVIDAAPSPKFAALELARVSFQQIPTRDGFPMESALFLPHTPTPGKRLPVVMLVYGGPQLPTVKDAFSARLLWNHFLCQQGYAVLAVDNRSASGKGIKQAWPVHKNLGPLELADLEDAARWLAAQDFLDPERIAISGWSFGGTMASYAMTHSDVFRCGVAGAPVTSWTLYDSIYTERYMGLLSENAAGYQSTSVLAAAKDLSGPLLLLHGTLDDNVHPQNTLLLLDALQAAGKTPELVLLPGSDHSPRARAHTWAQYSATFRFLQQNL